MSAAGSGGERSRWRSAAGAIGRIRSFSPIIGADLSSPAEDGVTARRRSLTARCPERDPDPPWSVALVDKVEACPRAVSGSQF